MKKRPTPLRFALAAALLSTACAALAAPTYSVTDLGTLGGSPGQALAINESGQVVGYAYSASNTAYHAFRYGTGGMRDLGTLGGSHSQAYGINDSGVAVGWAHTAGNTAQHAFSHGPGGMQDLSTLGGSYSFAYAINGSGQVVGVANIVGNRAYHAFLYGPGGILDLNDLIDPLAGWTISDARDINDSGQIAAWGCSVVGCRALRLDPILATANGVPEPGTLALLGLGFAGLGVARRRRR